MNENSHIHHKQSVKGSNQTNNIIGNEQDNSIIIQSPMKGLRSEMEGRTLKECVLWEIKELISQVLGIPKDKFYSDENLADYGFDSISLGEFSTVLNNKYSIDMTPDVFFGYPTVDRLSEYLLNKYNKEMEEFHLVGKREVDIEFKKPIDSISREIGNQRKNSGSMRTSKLVSSHRTDSIMTFEEIWQNTELVINEKSIRSIVIFVTNETSRQVIGKKIKQLSPDTELFFIRCGDHYEKKSTNSFTVNEGDKSGYITSFKEIKASVGNVDAVLYMWPIEDGKWITDPTGILYMLQGMAEARVKTKRVLIAGGYKDELERSHIESWIGIERSTGLIMPGTKISIVIANCEETGSVDWAELLWKELHATKAESVWYRGNRRKVSRIRPKQIEKNTKNVPLKKRGVYLLTGGVGGLGMIFSRWLAEKYHAKLILINRSSLESKKDKLKQLQDIGAEVLYFSADVCDSEQLKRAVQAGKERFGKIDGVIHAAGIEGKGSILEKSMEDYLRCLGPKVQGTLALEEALQGEKLDFMCYFSSSSAIIGDFGNCDYAVGNRFLMSYGTYRDKADYTGKTVVINWPLWKSEGMGFADEEGSKMYLKSSGQRFIESEEGTEIFEELLQQTNIQHLVMTGNKERIYKFLRLEEKSEVAVNKVKEKKKVMVSPGKGRKSEMKDWSIEQCVLWELKDAVNQILKVPKERMDVEENLADFGFDSISLIEFGNNISSRYKLNITPDVFFGYPTLKRLSGYLLDKYIREMEGYYKESEEKVNLKTKNVTNIIYTPDGKKKRNSRRKRFSNNSTIKEELDPIAIIGISGRFPEARNVAELWSILVDGREVIKEAPSLRTEWTKEDGKEKKFGVLPGIPEFEPSFFEISPREAMSMDPRQRLLLQETWRALEDAGYRSRSYDSKKVGMFVGIEEGDYKSLVDDEASITSNHNAILAARLSYFLDLEGPNMAINTACSSGLVALHQACQSLRNGECDTAIAAGANLMTTPGSYISMSKAGMLSEDNRCYAFDKRANGMVPAEAIAVVVLKRLSKAEADKNPVYATILGSGINYDGKTNGITAPSGPSQSNLIKEVYERFTINPQDMEYIVTHGTGTKLGDPVEINALAEAFKDFTEESSYCALTSVKPNIGHTLAASGIVSLISLVMSLKHETIPASINCEQLNDYIHWENSPFYVNRANREWKDRGGKKRLGAVSSFGMSGTNAHVVVQSYIPEEKERNHQTKSKEIPYYLLALSAKTPESLQQRIHDIKVIFERKQDMGPSELANISYTLMEGRQHFQYRCAIVVTDTKDAILLLGEAGSNGIGSNLFKGTVSRDFTAETAITKSVKELIERCQEVEGIPKTYKENIGKLAGYYCLGYEVSCEKLLSQVKPTKVNLPTYPFIKKEYWVNKKISRTLSKNNDYNQSIDVSKETREYSKVFFQQKQVEQKKDKIESKNEPTVKLKEVESLSSNERMITTKFTRIALNPLTVSSGFSSKDSLDIKNKKAVALLELPSQEKSIQNDKVEIPKEKLLKEVSKSLAEELYMEEEDIDLEKSFIELGLDSIVGV
ncbi:SDR family NAD(P)-dependent oxidoreductase, partial [Niallia sp. HCP3S3_B10]|uniref:SDR family NAD(P)-dependent oxidoreductase n=1 Tax=Niallia sp. HCP3S3_B10 TaxID=3438944 RepID=UPI003F8CC674